MNKDQIEIELLRCEADNYEGNFVAVAVQIKNNSVSHSGLLINSDEGTFLFHFNGSKVLLEDPHKYDWYFYKIFKFIDERLVSAFLALCKTIQKENSPKLGYYFDGSFFDSETGHYFNKTAKSEYMTCVGFCINVIKGFLSEDDEVEVFQYKDWRAAEIDPENVTIFLKNLQLENPGLDISLLSANIRRILPIEFLASAYLKSMPFNKRKISLIVPKLDDILKSKVGIS